MLPPLFKLTWPSGGKGNGMRVKRPLWASMSLLVKDKGLTGQAQSFLASLTVCGWAYGEHPVTVTIKETACCLINCKRCWWSETLCFGRIICSPLYGGHPAVKDWPLVKQSSYPRKEAAWGKAILLSSYRRTWWNQPPLPAPQQPTMSADLPQGCFLSCLILTSNRQVGKSKDVTLQRVWLPSWAELKQPCLELGGRGLWKPTPPIPCVHTYWYR